MPETSVRPQPIHGHRQEIGPAAGDERACRAGVADQHVERIIEPPSSFSVPPEPVGKPLKVKAPVNVLANSSVDGPRICAEPV